MKDESLVGNPLHNFKFKFRACPYRPRRSSYYIFHLDEVVGSPPAHCAAADLRVVDQVLRPGEALVHPLNCEEGWQVGGVAGDHQQGKHPPQTGQHPGAGSPGILSWSIDIHRSSKTAERRSLKTVGLGRDLTDSREAAKRHVEYSLKKANKRLAWSYWRQT